MRKRAGTRKAKTMQGDTLRRTDSFNEGTQVAVVDDERNIQNLIRTVRGVQVMLDRDMARLYGVETGALNRQVKRNQERFPEDFMFRLSVEEWENLKCQNGITPPKSAGSRPQHSRQADLVSYSP